LFGIGHKENLMNNTQLVKGSLGAIAQQNNASIAETFINADCIIICDTSGSMMQCDARGDRSRYDVACEELKNLQASLPGKLALLSFSDEVIFCPSGVPFNFEGGTNLAKALQFAKVADVTGIRFIVISDGEPSDEEGCIRIAKTFKAKIDTIFVGPEGGDGAAFLRRLAKASGGQGVTADRVKELSANVQRLLLT
jgi:Mg-chelatase subunit ChlD